MHKPPPDVDVHISPYATEVVRDPSGYSRVGWNGSIGSAGFYKYSRPHMPGSLPASASSNSLLSPWVHDWDVSPGIDESKMRRSCKAMCGVNLDYDSAAALLADQGGCLNVKQNGDEEQKQKDDLLSTCPQSAPYGCEPTTGPGAGAGSACFALASNCSTADCGSFTTCDSGSLSDPR